MPGRRTVITVLVPLLMAPAACGSVDDGPPRDYEPPIWQSYDTQATSIEEAAARLAPGSLAEGSQILPSPGGVISGATSFSACRTDVDPDTASTYMLGTLTQAALETGDENAVMSVTVQVGDPDEQARAVAEDSEQDCLPTSDKEVVNLDHDYSYGYDRSPKDGWTEILATAIGTKHGEVDSFGEGDEYYEPIPAANVRGFAARGPLLVSVDWTVRDADADRATLSWLDEGRELVGAVLDVLGGDPNRPAATVPDPGTLSTRDPTDLAPPTDSLTTKEFPEPEDFHPPRSVPLVRC